MGIAQTGSPKGVLWAVLLAVPVGVLAGSASALFLWALDLATGLRERHELLIYLLPLAGVALGVAYDRWAGAAKAGTNLVINVVAPTGPVVDPGAFVHARMAPMVLLGTVFTHVFGGSAGREGTAVQMGASLADTLGRRVLPSPAHVHVRQLVILSGVAGGFGSVFGTPLAGAVFAAEFAVRGRLRYQALGPALVAALVGDTTTRLLGIGHTHYPRVAPLALGQLVLLKWAVFAVAVALTSSAFIELTHGIKKVSERYLGRLPLRMFAGGLVVVALWRLTDGRMYLGLGVPTIVRAFQEPALPGQVFALKLLFTAVTIGAGFVGGEVTPLFFVGATLGSALGAFLGLPVELAAAVGMTSLFACAAKTPFALMFMAVELFGINCLPHVAFVAAIAYFLGGDRSIYTAQRPASGS